MTADEIKAELQLRLDPNGRINEDIKFSSHDGHAYLNHVPLVVCADGFTMSVQASHFHYCQPRDSAGPWRSVEVGYPTAKVDAFMPYIDGGENDDPLATVYGYVPIDLVIDAIAAHGGFSTSALSSVAS